MGWRRLIRPFAAANGGEAVDRDVRSVEAVQALFDSMEKLGFVRLTGQAADFKVWGQQATFVRDHMRVRVTNDRGMLLFDAAAESAPEDWHLLTFVKAAVEDAPLADAPEPTSQEVVMFLGHRKLELADWFAPDHWVRSQSKLRERERQQTKFMLELLGR